jgi:heptosyltransferase-2
MKRLLVRLPNWLGDALMSRPLLASLRAWSPERVRVLIGPPAVLELLRAEDADARFEAWPATVTERDALARRLRAEPADLGFALPPSFSSAVFLSHCGARERIGFAGEGRSWLLTRALRRGPRGDRHLSEEYLALGVSLGVPERPAPPLAIPAAWRERAAALLSDAGHAGGAYAVLAPGAIYGPAKRWPAERFAVVADALAARGVAAVLAGGASDRDACREVAGRRKAATLDLCGRTTLSEMAGLCAGAAAVVSNDSGLAHLAAATGAPTVVVFGSTSSAWTAPLGPRVRVVQHAPVCAPCFQRTCTIGYRCLTAVSAAEVERACRELAA